MCYLLYTVKLVYNDNPKFVAVVDRWSSLNWDAKMVVAVDR